MKEKSVEETIPFGEFKRLRFKVGLVKEVQNHPNADKLFVIRVDLGDEERQLVAGLKGYYGAEEMVGKKVVVVTNLEAARLRGVESRGMLLAAQSGSVVSLLTVDKDVPAGSEIL